MRWLSIPALILLTLSIHGQGSGTVGYNRTTRVNAPTNLVFTAESVTAKITNASLYSVTGILKGDGIGGSVAATAGTDYQAAISGTPLTVQAINTQAEFEALLFPLPSGGGSSVLVNGAEVTNPNLTNSPTALVSVTTTNVTFYPTNLANAQISASANISESKLDSTLARDSELTAGLALKADLNSPTLTTPNIGAATATTLVSSGKVTIGTGDNFGIQATISAGQLMDIRRGTMASPIVTSNGPAIRVTQTLEIDSATTTGDGSDFAPAIQGLSQGATNNGIQPVGVYGGAKSYSTNQTTSGADDALGGYFLGRSYGTGAGIGLTAYAMREGNGGSDGFAHGMETVIFNNSGVASSYFSTGVGKDVNILMAPGGTADSVAAIQMHQSRGVQWAHGLAIGGNTVSNKVGAVRDSSIRDDGNANISLEINGKHTNGAIVIDNTAGYLLVGESTPSFPSSRMSVISSNGYSADPLLFIGHPAFSSNYSAFIRNSVGTLRLGIAGTASFIITGSSAGDAVITPSSGKSLHLGGTGKVVSVGQDNTLGFFAATQVAKQNTDVRTALINYGLLDSASTASSSFDALSPNTTRGDLTVRGASSNGRLAIGRTGQILMPWPNTDNTVDLAWKKAPQVFEFTSSNAAEWSTVIANSGTQSQGQADDGNDLGQFIISTGTLTNGVGGYRLSTTSTRFSSGSIALHWRFSTPATLSTDADGYEIYAGFGDISTTDAAPTDGAYVFYTHGVNSGAWLGRTANNTTVTPASGGGTVPVVASTWYDVIVEGTSSSVNFWVSNDNAATWTWIGSSASNIPSSAGRETGIETYIRKIGGSVGTTARTATLGRCLVYSH